jgi:hypothetical protein
MMEDPNTHNVSTVEIMQTFASPGWLTEQERRSSLKK